jgi:hypothetical protein
MDEQPSKVQRALGAIREDVWSDLQHRRVAKRLDEALSRPVRADRRWFWGLATATLCALVVVIAWRARHGHVIVAEGSSVGSDGEAMSAVFSDGSKLEVAPGGHVQVVVDRPDETRIEVVAGRAEFEVAKRPSRPFVTSIRGVEVRVIGTRFSTELDLAKPPGVVRVQVHRGVVEVSRPGGSPSRLSAGERLEVPLGPASPSPAASSLSTAEVGSPTSAPSAAPSSTTAPVVPSPPSLDASKLFEGAKAARASGDVEGAIRLYSALLKQFPNDERVGVAALELGRLRMDVQHAYGPAAEAFRRAIARAPNEGVREDALARLVEVLDAMHDRESCLAERFRYLQRYPKGVHRSRIERECEER